MWIVGLGIILSSSFWRLGVIVANVAIATMHWGLLNIRVMIEGYFNEGY